MNTNKILFAAIAIILILQVLSFFTGENATLGSATHFSGPVDSEDGFSVDDTVVIDGSGNWDGAITGTSGTLSSTLSVTGATTLSTTSVGSLFINSRAFSTTTGSNGSTTAATICSGSDLWLVTPLLDSSTLLFPGTTTLATETDCLGTIGYGVEFTIFNATNSDTGNIFLSKGWELGTKLQGITSTDVLRIPPQRGVKVKLQTISVTTTTISVK